jgi:class 3 adenylate cyclase
VFTLLETIYGAFDKIAYECNVFKVETVGGCYVAAAGLPEPMDDHAIAAARFSRFILQRMKELARTLEVTLGPDTTDLKLRVGMNSGQVTAGVLRGQRARFQLFGDTMNIAARMETTSKLGHIQVSAATADLLKQGFRSSWIEPRTESVAVKGKGLMQTYWLLSKHHGSVKRSKSGRVKQFASSEADNSSVGRV